jgi:phosphoribosyl-ATP pyrophosphohydrolase/phosphoribosyl-AMP cyclohydrolase
MRITVDNLDRLDFKKGGGLLPAVVQDATSGAVLMVGWMNPKALRETLHRGRVVFWSRSHGSLWEKGETSGNTLSLHTITADCDLDTLLVTASPGGPTCHLGTTTCFGEPSLVTGAFIGRLQSIIASRLESAPGTATRRGSLPQACHAPHRKWARKVWRRRLPRCRGTVKRSRARRQT